VPEVPCIADIYLSVVVFENVAIAPGGITVPCTGAVADVGKTAVGADVLPSVTKTGWVLPLYIITCGLLISISTKVADLLVLSTAIT